MVMEEWPYDVAVPLSDFAGMYIDFGPLEAIVKRAFDPDERRNIATAAWRIYAAYPYGLPMTWRAWERSFRKGGLKAAFRLVQSSSKSLSSSPPSKRRRAVNEDIRSLIS